MSLSRKARKGVAAIDTHTQQLIVEAIETLKNDPVPTKKYDVKKLLGSESDYRIRIGQYRVQYTVYREEKAILVFYINRRSDNTYK
ncbi:MAG: type II toxin-antitoxin system RelE/ParE family toxin [Candidatus Iainarchaeum archaeon]|uniref:Type II toxin-antitoxin system RelE/ParE family toxin n=1 Tax=Candidatus Iainarchaeum sp. TaxID=3101447 RepID=A0A7T9I285_9ARCH|nr:MAG: type II toxin-antitoxin system RelE/ParE family toxin [Candidatus Diapherotrites archaeon]